MKDFFKDMFTYVGMMMVGLVMAVCVSAIIIEAYEWVRGVFFA